MRGGVEKIGAEDGQASGVMSNMDAMVQALQPLLHKGEP